MKTLQSILMASIVAAVIVPASGATAADVATGLWYDHTGRGAVEISDCGGKLCGKIVWLKDAKNAKGCGIQVLANVPPAGPNTWDGGWIYDPDEDSKYDVELKLVSTDKLKVTGYAGVKFLGETMMWTRAPLDIQRCQ
ncbi:MAG: DUF2147 domain-containing protein [Hyphomicrobiaceae bacterium]